MKRKLPTEEVIARAANGMLLGSGKRAAMERLFDKQAGVRFSRLARTGILRAAVHRFLTAEHDHNVRQTHESLKAKANARIGMALAAGYSEENLSPRPACAKVGPEPHRLNCTLPPGHSPPHGWPEADRGRGVFWNDAGQLVEDPRKPVPAAARCMRLGPLGLACALPLSHKEPHSSHWSVSGVTDVLYWNDASQLVNAAGEVWPGIPFIGCPATLGEFRCCRARNHDPAPHAAYDASGVTEWTDRPEPLVPRKST